MTNVSRKEIGEALQNIAEQIHALDQRLAKLELAGIALKWILAKQASPDDPAKFVREIESLEKFLAERDPNAAARKQFSEVLEMVKIVDKHGGPKQA